MVYVIKLFVQELYNKVCIIHKSDQINPNKKSLISGTWDGDIALTLPSVMRTMSAIIIVKAPHSQLATLRLHRAYYSLALHIQDGSGQQSTPADRRPNYALLLNT